MMTERNDKKFAILEPDFTEMISTSRYSRWSLEGKLLVIHLFKFSNNIYGLQFPVEKSRNDIYLENISSKIWSVRS